MIQFANTVSECCDYLVKVKTLEMLAALELDMMRAFSYKNIETGRGYIQNILTTLPNPPWVCL